MATVVGSTLADRRAGTQADPRAECWCGGVDLDGLPLLGRRHWRRREDVSSPRPADLPSPVRLKCDTVEMEVTAKGHNGTILFDGDFVTIHRKGGLARLTIGKGDKRIPVSSITAVQWKPPGSLVNGFISFSLGGAHERQSSFGSQSFSAASDENSVMVTKAQAAAFLELREAVETEIANRARPGASVKGPDPMDQLLKLSELRAAGIVSEAEFQAKKAQLLGL